MFTEVAVSSILQNERFVKWKHQKTQTFFFPFYNSEMEESAHVLASKIVYIKQGKFSFTLLHIHYTFIILQFDVKSSWVSDGVINWRKLMRKCIAK